MRRPPPIEIALERPDPERDEIRDMLRAVRKKLSSIYMDEDDEAREATIVLAIMAVEEARKRVCEIPSPRGGAA